MLLSDQFKNWSEFMKRLSIAHLKQKRKRLIQQFKEIDSLLMRGSLIERYKKCGKSNCKCATEKGHGPKYYLSITLPNSNPIMVYVSTELKATVEKALLNHLQIKNILEELSHVNRELLIRKQLP